MPDAENYQHYQVLRREDGSLWELGRGAMGITYKAFDTNLRCTVALKVINNAYLESEVARQRFLREARAAAALRHQNVASVFHLGSDHDSYFYAMEFIDGQTVDAYMASKGQMEPVEALRICLQVTRALAAAARQQLVHRDLKPANLMLVDEDGEKIVKVIDFGLAKSAKREGEDSGTLTIAGGFVGTPHFASPEQLEERDIDIRSDIYSLGATLYYMLTGRPPFSGSVAQIMSQHLYKPIPLEPLSGIPPCVTGLIEKMMQKDREKRPQTPTELRQEIVNCLAQLQGATSTALRTEPNAEAVTTVALEPIEKSPGTEAEVPPDEPLSRESILGRRYQIVRELDEVPQGRQFLAYDLRQSRQLILLVFSAGFLAEKNRFTSVEEEVNRLQTAHDSRLRQVFSVESTVQHTFLVQEWVVGPTLLDILRARSTLTAHEVIRLLDQLAPLADHATQKNLKMVDMTLTGIQLTYPGLIQAAISPQLLQKPLTGWPGLTVKVAALDFSTSGTGADQATWAGSATLVQGAGASGGPRSSYLRLLSLLAYELLGGQRIVVETSGRISPVTALSEGGNVVLRRAITDDYPGATAMVAELRQVVSGAEPTVAPIAAALPVAEPPAKESAPVPEIARVARYTPIPEPSTPRPEQTQMPVAGSGAAVGSVAGNKISIPPPLPPAPTDSRPGETTVPSEPPRRPASNVGILLVAAMGVLLFLVLGVGGFLVWHFAFETPGIPTPTPFAKTSPSPSSTASAAITASPKPSASAIVKETVSPTQTTTPGPTPKPTASTVVENSPSPSVSPVETREAALQRQLDTVAESIRNGDWSTGIERYISLSSEYPESSVPRDKLENLISAIRSSKKITSSNFSEYQPDLEQAATLGSVQAMLLLGENTRQTDVNYALRWFEAAAAKGNNHGRVQAGLVLSNRKEEGDAARAFEYFKAAADDGDSEGKFTTGESLYLGKGTTVDVPKALTLLQESAAMNEPRAMDMLGGHYRRAKDYQKARSYFEEAAQLGYIRSIVNLGVLYWQGEGVAQNYQTAVSLFKKGAEHGDSYGMFFYSQCLADGKGVQKDFAGATEWAKKSAQSGNPLAIQWLQQKKISY
jgi:TPR repeat protein/tRNA A-37 threonylcarbamoyl transferase component Bud32